MGLNLVPNVTNTQNDLQLKVRLSFVTTLGEEICKKDWKPAHILYSKISITAPLAAQSQTLPMLCVEARLSKIDLLRPWSAAASAASAEIFAEAAIYLKGKNMESHLWDVQVHDRKTQSVSWNKKLGYLKLQQVKRIST